MELSPAVRLPDGTLITTAVFDMLTNLIVTDFYVTVFALVAAKWFMIGCKLRTTSIRIPYFH